MNLDRSTSGYPSAHADMGEQMDTATSTSIDGKIRNPNRRPLPVDKDVFARLQQTQRLQRGLHDFPEFDLGFLGTAALRIVYAMPDADQRILKQVCLDFSQKVRGSSADVT